jgi:phosphoglycolate phosphatase
MEIKAVIFDLDGTLLDTLEDIADANNKMLSKFNYPQHPFEKYIKWIGNGATKLIIDSLPESANFNEDRIHEYLKTYTSIYKENIANKTKVYKGIEELLVYLCEKNIPIAINTNKPKVLTDLVCESCLKPWPFQLIIGDNGDYPKKPKPESSIYIANQLVVSPANVLFIGDSEVDLETAKNAGMQFMGVRWGYGNHKLMMEIGYQNLVESPIEIIDFIESGNRI